MTDEMPQRVERIETHVAHLEHQVEQLNEVVIEQGKLLERLKKEVHRLGRTLDTVEMDRLQSQNQKPPHY